MILIDTSIWVDHLRNGDQRLTQLLNARQVLVHPFVIGELALGYLRQRRLILENLRALPHIAVATHDEVMTFIDRQKLFGLGIGYVDAHLLAAVRLEPGTTLWTRDKRLSEVADGLGLAQ